MTWTFLSAAHTCVPRHRCGDVASHCLLCSPRSCALPSHGRTYVNNSERRDLQNAVPTSFLKIFFHPLKLFLFLSKGKIIANSHSPVGFYLQFVNWGSTSSGHLSSFFYNGTCLRDTRTTWILRSWSRCGSYCNALSPGPLCPASLHPLFVLWHRAERDRRECPGRMMFIFSYVHVCC